MKDIHGGRNVDESRFPSDTGGAASDRGCARSQEYAWPPPWPADLRWWQAAPPRGAAALILASAPTGPCSVLSVRAAASTFGLTADAGDSQVRLTWTPPTSVKNLAVCDRTTPGTDKPVEVSTATDTSALVIDLTNGTTYYFWLVADGRVVSNTASATPAAPPGAPGGLTATAGNAQVTLFVGRARVGWRFAGQRLQRLPGDQPGRRDRHPGQRLAGHRHQLYRNRADQRDHVLLQGDRGQRRGAEPFVGRGVGHPGDRAGGARRADRDCG